MKNLSCVAISLLLAGCIHHSKSENLYQVCWVGPYTRETYCGSPISRRDAEAWAKQSNAENFAIHHYVIKAR